VIGTVTARLIRMDDEAGDFGPAAGPRLDRTVRWPLQATCSARARAARTRGEMAVMIVGVCRIRLHLLESHSLKDKRQVVKSVLARVRGQFEVAAAEVEDLEIWQVATLGLACATNDAGYAHDVLDHAARYIEDSRPDVEITDVEIDVQRMLE
jgi:uncharacterized protein